MTLQDRIESAMRDSMRARDERRTQTLRMAMSAAHNRQIELGKALTDEDYVEILGKQVKQRRESIEAFRSGGREAMADNEEAEAAILAEFLPEPLSGEELESLVRAAIAETGAASPADLGKVMGKVVPQTKGRADGKAVSDLVRRLLGS
ncbi:MAG TPA: GatB/YqeY domain-containing protein [Candidatus Limnocylindria bacterium]|nr:GatB/YqeY domain-containing protein [Candidatus Limnocylindria bacterium]